MDGNLQLCLFKENLDFIFLWVSHIIKFSWEKSVRMCNSCAVVCAPPLLSVVFKQTD